MMLVGIPSLVELSFQLVGVLSYVGWFKNEFTG